MCGYARVTTKKKKKKIKKEEKLEIPNNDDTVNNLNFVFLGDEAFALHEHILKPYSQRELTHEKRVFNYRLSQARNCVENTFGLISSRFRLLQRAINLNPEKASYTVLAICAIHNFLRKRGGPYVTSTMFDRQEDTNILKNGEWRENVNNELLGLQCTRQKNVSTEAKINRDNYMHFFNNQGSVDFQEDMDWKLNRHKFSDITLLRELEEKNPDDYKNYLRMDSKDFQFLLELIGPKIRKQDTVMRAAISAEERLISTLRFLATERSYEDLKFSTCISATSLSFIIPETCKAIFEALQMDYLKFPTTKDEWKTVAMGFCDRWQFVNCGGSIDGKHIRILQPPGTGAQF
ncbi:hypothetical protein QTP88_022810 [Uroleucon formosanum]